MTPVNSPSPILWVQLNTSSTNSDKILRKIRKKLKNDLIFLFLSALIFIFRFLPRKTAFLLARIFAKLAYGLLPKERKKTIENLTLVFGKEKSETEIKKLAQEVFVNLALSGVDAIRLIKYQDKIAQMVEVENEEVFDEAYRRGKGIMTLTGHVGCFELMGPYFNQKGYKTVAIGRELYDKRLDKILVENRKKSGVQNIPSTASVKEIMKILKEGKVLGVLIDQNSNKVRNVKVNFFGKPVNAPVGPALIALKTGSPIVPLAIVRNAENSYRIIVGQKLEPKVTEDNEKEALRLTQECTLFLEQIIRKYPAQWVWMHNRWGD